MYQIKYLKRNALSVLNTKTVLLKHSRKYSPYIRQNKTGDTRFQDCLTIKKKKSLSPPAHEPGSRFGNQVDYLLGALAFSKAINRTFILPPWVEYRYPDPNSIQTPFDTYFKVETLGQYHRVITMEIFMANNAPKIWPKSKRISFCDIRRKGELKNSCNAKSGLPYRTFWDTFNTEFVGSEFYGPLNHDTFNNEMMDKWKQRYSPGHWPVLAFTVAPASFPIQNGNQILHKYLIWNEDYVNKSKLFIKYNMNGGGFIGIHLRNSPDWAIACNKYIRTTSLLYASPQCLGYRSERGRLTLSMCLPQKSEMLKQIKRVLKKLNDIKFIYVASDSLTYMSKELDTALQYSDITTVRLQHSNPQLDLAILGQADYFIGNCVSSFTAFVKRERDIKGLPSEFWSFPQHEKAKYEL